MHGPRTGNRSLRTHPVVMAVAMLLLGSLPARPAFSELQFLPLRSFLGPTPLGYIGFGESVAPVGDVDGDGVRDFAVGAPRGADYRDFRDIGGQVIVYSGRSSREIYRLTQGRPYENFGSSLAGGCDVDGDGVDDLLVGWPDAGGSTFNPGSGAAFMYSAATGTILRRWDGGPEPEHLGSTVAFVGDLDGDGIRDVAITRWWAEVWIYSSTTGALIHVIEPPPNTIDFGSSIADLGDVTGDGVSDIAIGAPGSCFATDAGLIQGVWIVDGGTGLILWGVPARPGCNRFGRSLASVPDLDGDGHRDLAISSSEMSMADTLFISSTAPPVPSEDGLLRVVPADSREGSKVDGGRWSIASVSGIDGTPGSYVAIGSPDAYSGPGYAGALALYSIEADSITQVVLGVRKWEFLGSAVSAFGDVNGDGRSDLLVTAPGVQVGRPDVLPGGVAVYGFAEVEPSRVASATGDGRVNLASSVPLDVYVEGAAARYAPGDVVPETIRLRLAANVFRSINSISTAPLVSADTDHDGAPEFQARFSMSDVREMFRYEDPPVDTASVVVECDLSDGRRVQAPLLLTIGTPPVAGASVIPNPVRGAGNLAFRTSTSGEVRLRVFDLQGRLVATPLDGEWMPYGIHLVPLGLGSSRPLPSGVYFYRLETPDGGSKGRIVLIK